MQLAQERIQRRGSGIIIFLPQEGKGNGHLALVASAVLKHQGKYQSEAYEELGFEKDSRNYFVAGKILKYFGIKSVILLSNNPGKANDLILSGINVVETQSLIVPEIKSKILLNSYQDKLKQGHKIDLELLKLNKNYLANLEEYFPYEPTPKNSIVLCIGDLMCDYILYCDSLDEGIFEKPEPIIGGTVINGAIALKNQGINSIVFGKLGNDAEAKLIVGFLKDHQIGFSLGSSNILNTGSVLLVYYKKENKRLMVYDTNNSNDYDVGNLKSTLNSFKLCSKDIALLIGHPLYNFPSDYSKNIIDAISKFGLLIVLDVVPHNMYNKVDKDILNYIISDKVSVIISEYLTLMKILRVDVLSDRPSALEIDKIFSSFRISFLVLRFGGEGNIDIQMIVKRIDEDSFMVLEENCTGYSLLKNEEKRSFGDVLTAKFINKYLVLG